VRRVLISMGRDTEDAMGFELDRDVTSADALKNYKKVVLHYLHHKPLLEDMTQGYFEGRCPSCEWIGRVGRRRPHCSRCGGQVVPV